MASPFRSRFLYLCFENKSRLPSSARVRQWEPRDRRAANGSARLELFQSAPVAGRRLAYATFFNSHATDATNAISLAMDLTPLVRDDTLSVREFALGHIDRLRADVAGRIAKFGG